MLFFTNCPNKGCRKDVQPFVDKDTMIAYCPECNGEMNNINLFMRRQLAANGNVRKDSKTKAAWSVKCESCKKEAPPVITNDKKILCSFCNKEMTGLNKFYANSLILNLKNKK